jgi:hypothetical protein
MLWGRIGAIAQKFTITKVYGRFEEELKFKTTITGDTIHYTRYTATLYPVLGGQAIHWRECSGQSSLVRADEIDSNGESSLEKVTNQTHPVHFTLSIIL